MAIQNDADAAYQVFFDATPAYHPYQSLESLQALAQYIADEFGIPAGNNPNSWDIAFRALMQSGKLVRNPDYISNADKKRLDRMSVADVKHATRSEAGFPDLWNRYSKAVVPVESTTSDPWAGLTSEQYKGIPPVKRAQLYAQNYDFRKNVSRLIDEGSI
jgi:hypothetical protein